MENKSVKKQRAIVIGDVWAGNVLVPKPKESSPESGQNHQPRDTENILNRFLLPGGALMVGQMMRGMAKIAPRKSGVNELEVLSYPVKDLGKFSNKKICQWLAEGVMEKGGKEAKKGSTKNGYPKYYIKKVLGHSDPGPAGGVPDFAANFSAGPMGDGDVVIIEDANKGFRNKKSAWLSVIDEAAKKENSIIIYRMSGNLFTGKLWDALCQKGLLKRTVFIIDAEALREEGVNISRKVSWDRTIADFVTIRAYKKYPSLEKCPHVLVRFGLEGVMYYNRELADDGDPGNPGGEKESKITARMFYVPARCEKELMENCPGRIKGLSSAFTGFLAWELIGFGKGGEPAFDLGRGISDAVAPSAERVIQLLNAGYKNENDRLVYPFKKICSEKSPGFIKRLELRDLDVGYLESSRKQWSILSHRIPRDFDLNNIATNYVLHGNVDGLANVPMVEFGNLKTVDKNEIESFRAIKNLIKEYGDDVLATKPLSIAIFGPPGSGKSFAVKSVVKAVMGNGNDGKGTKVLEYNISQFQSPGDIVRAFHEVRDYSLKGIIPLVFFDEFDSSFQKEPLGWLKYFLAPMQDGEFKEGEKTHPIGRAILVFAGGTSPSLKGFTRESQSGEKGNDAELQRFISAKGPDFVSRLKGYVNILGPNPINMENYSDTAPRFDRFYIIRRAVLLRVILKQQKNIVEKGGKIRIDDDVLRALLLAPKYKHGARSMNAIVNMSLLGGRNRFEKAALPSPQQLSLHVDPDVFMNILERDLIIETAAIDQKIHEIYRDTQRAMENPKPEDHTSMADWKNLDDELKGNNRMLAENIPLKLLLINCSYRPKTKNAEDDQPLIMFSQDEVDYLARMAHERWLEEKVTNGWTYGNPRDDKRKKHDCIVEWEVLPEHLKLVDQNTIKSIPRMLDEAGFEVYRL